MSARRDHTPPSTASRIGKEILSTKWGVFVAPVAVAAVIEHANTAGDRRTDNRHLGDEQPARVQAIATGRDDVRSE